MALRDGTPSDWLGPEQAPQDPQFWREWLQQAASALGASFAMIMEPGGAGRGPRPVLKAGNQTRDLPPELVPSVLSDEPLRTVAAEGGGGWFAVRLPWEETGETPLVAVGEVAGASWPNGPDAAWCDRALLWATAAGRRRRIRELRLTRQRADELAHALELAVLVREQKNFKAAALEVCNQLAARHSADRVALGWWREPYVRLAAVSQVNRLEAKMTAVGSVEAAMEETIEQDVSLVWPTPDVDKGAIGDITAQHAALGREQGWGALCTVTLRARGEVVGAVTWHRLEGAFTADEAEGFALVLDGLGPVLAEQEKRDGWWGRRWKRTAEEAMKSHWNLRNPWGKLAAVSGALILALLLLVHVPYRVEAEFSLRPEKQMVFTAAFDGFVEGVAVSPGDFVAAEGQLYALDATALRLEEGELLADLSRYEREREQAEAQRDLAAMRVAEAQRDQVSARLQRLRRQISQTVAVAPFAGFVLDDGNLSERLGAPVQQGDALLRFAQLDGMYFELAVKEADASLIAIGTEVDIAFRGRPDEVVTARVSRIEPEAVVQGQGAFFIVRATPVEGLEDWWRPGMTGLGKLITDKRSLMDIFTRRLRDWLHLQLWW